MSNRDPSSSPVASRPRHLVWSRLSHGVIAAVVLAALGWDQVRVILSSHHSPGLLRTLIREYSFFTQQSNIAVLAAALTLVLNPWRDGVCWRVLRADAVLGILITGVVYPVLLARGSQLTGSGFWINVSLHYLSPWAVVMAWLVFGPRPRMDRRTAALALIWPLLWVGYTLLHGSVSGWYPYYFLDVGKMGYPATLLMVAILIIFGALILLIMALVDRVLPVVGGSGSQRLPGRHSWD